MSEQQKDEKELTLFQCKLDKSSCDHNWQYGDGRNEDICTKCGQGFLAYVYMECP